MYNVLIHFVHKQITKFKVPHELRKSEIFFKIINKCNLTFQVDNCDGRSCFGTFRGRERLRRRLRSRCR